MKTSRIKKWVLSICGLPNNRVEAAINREIRDIEEECSRLGLNLVTPIQQRSVGAWRAIGHAGSDSSPQTKDVESDRYWSEFKPCYSDE